MSGKNSCHELIPNPCTNVIIYTHYALIFYLNIRTSVKEHYPHQLLSIDDEYTIHMVFLIYVWHLWPICLPRQEIRAMNFQIIQECFYLSKMISSSKK